MKREINFRAWAIVEKKMCQVTTLTDKGAFLVGIEPEADQILMDGKYIVRGCDNGRFLNNDEFELMQFTGLLDKNGKEIFEGDIIQHYDPNWGYGGKYDKINDGYIYSEISFEDGCFCLKDSVELYNYKEYEVIGNIYSNPELL